MKLVTAITQDYYDLQDIMRQSTRRAGYEVEVTILPDSYRVITPPGTWVAPSPWKPTFILQQLLAMRSLGLEDLLVWLDGDVAVLQNFDEVDTKDYDIAFTLRPEKTEWFLKVNTGVVFCYPTKASIAFLQEWTEAIPSAEYGSDQYAVNGLLQRREYRSFPASTYNYTTWSEPPPGEAKIVHCLSQYRAEAVEWVKNRLEVNNHA